MYCVTKYLQGTPHTWTDSLVRHKQQKKDLRFGTWNVRSLYKAHSFTAAARELARHELALVGVQEVRWVKGSMVRAGDYNFFYGKENEIHQLGTRLFVHHTRISGDKRVESVSNRILYILLRGSLVCSECACTK